MKYLFYFILLVWFLFLSWLGDWTFAAPFFLWCLSTAPLWMIALIFSAFRSKTTVTVNNYITKEDYNDSTETTTKKIADAGCTEGYKSSGRPPNFFIS